MIKHITHWETMLKMLLELRHKHTMINIVIAMKLQTLIYLKYSAQFIDDKAACHKNFTNLILIKIHVT